MGVLSDQISQTLPDGMIVPDPLFRLFDWIELNQLFTDDDGRRRGFLYPEDKLTAEWTERRRPGGTIISFSAVDDLERRLWLRDPRAEVLDRLLIFARTGAEGSTAAFWLDEHGQQKIVHLGSGSGSVLTCVLADDPVDFLRLLAIGYDEICWNDEFEYPPNDPRANNELFVEPNAAYQAWLTATFNTCIPQTALEIIRHPAELGDDDSPDPFYRWVSQIQADNDRGSPRGLR